MRRRHLLPALLAFGLAAPAFAQTTLVASAARTTSSTAAVVVPVDLVQSAVFQLTVSAAATDAGDTLDVYLQHTVDGGTTWDDFAHFTQVLGNGGAKKFLASWSRVPTPESELKAPADAALAAGVLQGPVGPTWRVKWVIVDAGTVNVSFTFAVVMQARR
jgi:hypothetical protein